MEIGSRGGGHHVQGLHVGAVVLALVCQHHLVRVTAKQVTISNEAGKRQEASAWIYLFFKVYMDQVTIDAMVRPYLGLALLPTCWYLTPCNLNLALGLATVVYSDGLRFNWSRAGQPC